jgi:hypothetical protein
MTSFSSRVRFQSTALRQALFVALLAAGPVLTEATARSQDPKPKIVIRASPQDKRDQKVLELRPNAALEQAFYVFVNNPTLDDKEFVVKLRATDGGPDLTTPVTVSVKAKQVAVVPFGQKPVTTGGSANEVKADVKPTLQTLAPIKDAQGNPKYGVQLVLTEKREGKEEEIEKRALPIGILTPSQYTEFADAKYDEAAGQVTVRLKARSEFSGPPCPVRLVLAPDRIPGMVPDSGTGAISQRLEKAGDEQTLTKRDLKFKDTPRGKGYGSITVDGYERAFVFEITLGQGGTSTPRLVGEDETTVRLYADRFIKPSEKYPVRVEVDNPRSPNLTVEIGLDRDGDGAYSPGEIVKLAGPRERHVQFRTDADRLIFKVDVTDVHTQLDVADMTGEHGLRVRLLNNDRVEDFLDKHSRKRESLDEKVTVTTAKPKNVKLDAKVEGGKIRVVAQADDETELTGAKFFLGKPIMGKDGKEAPADAVDGTQSSDNKSIWTGKLDLPADPKATAEISVELTNAVKMKAFETGTVVLAGAGPGDTKPGKIKVKVTENGRTQHMLEVVLRDAKNAEKDKKSKADDDGNYVFEDLPPGSYKVTTYKRATGRGGSLSLKVEAGKTAEDEIELKLMRKPP